MAAPMLQMSKTEGKILEMQLSKEQHPIEESECALFTVWRDCQKRRTRDRPSCDGQRVFVTQLAVYPSISTPVSNLIISHGQVFVVVQLNGFTPSCLYIALPDSAQGQARGLPPGLNHAVDVYDFPGWLPSNLMIGLGLWLTHGSTWNWPQSHATMRLCWLGET